MGPAVKCNICFQQKEPVYHVQEKRKEKISFCSVECYRIFMENVLAKKDGPAKLLQKDRFKIERKPRDESPDPKAPPNSLDGAAK